MLQLVLAIALLVSCLPAQALGEDRDPGRDQRDVVTQTSGKTVKCRVLRQDGNEVLIADGGSERTLDRVKSCVTVRMRLSAWFEERDKADRADVAAQWGLSRAADQIELPGMGRLQAMHVLLLTNGKHEAANERVGNINQNGTWHWRRGFEYRGGPMQHQEVLATAKKPYVIESEHWRLDTDTQLRRALDVLLDLERLYITFMAEFGEDLKAREVVWPMTVKLLENMKRFPKLATNPMPYVVPGEQLASADVMHTFYPADYNRPLLLFDVGTEQILYKTLMTRKSFINGLQNRADPERFAAWLEIGLGRWMGTRATGDPGYVKFGPARIHADDASVVVAYNAYTLPNLIGLRFKSFHEPTPERELHWANCGTLVAYLLDENTVIPGKTKRAPRIKSRPALLGYLRRIFEGAIRNSSSVLDAELGTMLEHTEEGWITWIEGTAGVKATRPKKPNPPSRLKQFPWGFPPITR